MKHRYHVWLYQGEDTLQRVDKSHYSRKVAYDWLERHHDGNGKILACRQSERCKECFIANMATLSQNIDNTTQLHLGGL